MVQQCCMPERALPTISARILISAMNVPTAKLSAAMKTFVMVRDEKQATSRV